MNSPTYRQWCDRYGYDPESRQAREDWQRYLDERAALTAAAMQKEEQTHER